MSGNARSNEVSKWGLARRLAAVSITVPMAALTVGCGGGEALLDAIGGATGDGGLRVKLTGPIMGEERMICIDNPPNITPAALQQEIDKYLFKAIRWDTSTPDKKTTVNKQIEGNRSCSYRLSPYMTMSWQQFVADAALNQQLADWGNFSAKFTVQGQRVVNVCMRDNECEDGDILDITLNGKAIVRSELFKEAKCFDVPVNAGVNFLGVYAVNGTGFKGQCSHEDRNTGVVTVYGASGSGRTQTYSVRGGQGSYGSLMIVN